MKLINTILNSLAVLVCSHQRLFTQMISKLLGNYYSYTIPLKLYEQFCPRVIENILEFVFCQHVC